MGTYPGERIAELESRAPYASRLIPVQEHVCCCSHSRNLSIAKGCKLAHPIGHPMSHSTHLGFRRPLGELDPRSIDSLDMIRSVRLTPGCAFDPSRLREPEPRESPFVGVGNALRRAIVSSDGRPRLFVLLPVPFPLVP